MGKWKTNNVRAKALARMKRKERLVFMKQVRSPSYFTIKATICRRCGGLLTDSDSIDRQYGPTCWEKISH